MVGGSLFTGAVVEIERAEAPRELLYLVEYSDGDQEHFTELQMRERVVDMQGVDAVVSGEMPVQGEALAPGCAEVGSLESDGRRRLSETIEGCEHQGDEENVCSDGACSEEVESAEVSEEDADEEHMEVVLQLYTRYRLGMERVFGSVASALYACGADSGTGRVRRRGFVELCHGLGILTLPEANLLFSQVSDSGLHPDGQEDFATHRDLCVPDEEWRQVVALNGNGDSVV